ncbi:alpha-ketoglutarate-dependent dioxygenase AlkB [Rheinheimera mesophila]|uniref:Alpha-ketoglutarate-dependent dioxygenase AlkB n=1 Tax=Rheinheimera mesophila TaxID=1547515 RepID=A0A3P3QTF0_9GAMM|nr:alpha-ketoglutarate-dependent dioxygenase AlkB [Rheinheimera mesophila]KKL03356.1 DNA methylase [Rheinheimera mesophila]RRJ23660.1 alpha-ketoglutarate-dependent dioxygenase AlkB [Rheinheimera mesophila]
MTRAHQSDNHGSLQHFALPQAELLFWPDWLSKHQADGCYQQLAQQLHWQQPAIKIFGKAVPIPRQQVWMGEPHCSYKYSGVLFEPEAWHPLVKQLTDQVNKLCQSRFNAVLLNWYADGQQHMGWHSDDEPELGDEPQIASLSLGQPRCFDLKHKTLGIQLKLELGHGSLLLMAGQCQAFWQHRVPKRAAATAGRINLTFREIKQKTT